MLDIRSPLMKRLAEIMPKKPEPEWDGLGMIPFRQEPIRMAAESFAAWIGNELPANDEELRATLWVFGEILNGEMERMLNSQIRRTNDLLDKMPFTSPIIFKLEDFAVGKQLSTVTVKEATDWQPPFAQEADTL